MKKERPSLAWRALLAVALMIGFYALTFFVCVALCAVIWYQERVHVPLTLCAAISIGVLCWSVWPRSERFSDPGVRLSPDDQPELWALVRSVARAARQDPPEEFFLVSDMNAFVNQRNSRLGSGGVRIIGIGLPLLQILTVPQLRSLIAHEFGHFHGGDTRLGPFVYRTHAAIGRTILNLRKAESIVQKPFEWYGRLFLRVSSAISRAQEFAADALSVRIVGREAFCSALRRVHQVAPLYDLYLRDCYLLALGYCTRPPLAAGFAQFLASKSVRRARVTVEEFAMLSRSNPYDSHPPLKERLDAAMRVDDPGSRSAAGPLGISLVRNLDEIEERLAVLMTATTGAELLRTSSWDDVLARCMLYTMIQSARDSVRHMPAVLVRDFADARGALMRITFSGMPDESRRTLTIHSMAMLLGHALYVAGFRVEADLGEPVAMVRGRARIEPFETARRVVDGDLDPSDWRTLCDRLQIGNVPVAGPAVVPAVMP